MENKKEERYRERRYIRIKDIDSWDLIDKIAQDDRYKKHFNKIINDALFYGLPILYDHIFGEVKLEETPPVLPQNILCFNQSQYKIIERLLREMVLNATINKSILSSIFHAMSKELNGEKVDITEYEEGLMSDTPRYLNDYEIRGIKSLRQ